LFVADASFVGVESKMPTATDSKTPPATATESLGFVQSDELSLSPVRDPSLGFRPSDRLETLALLLSANPPASAGLGAESSALCDSDGLRQSALGDSDGLPQSALGDSDGLRQSALGDSDGLDRNWR
jgi:hypothetical protein